MDGNARMQIAQQHEQCHGRERPPLLRAEEHELVELDLSHSVEDFHGARRERDAMLLAAFHSLSRHDPDATFEINLIPARTERFTAPCRSQYRELKSARANALVGAQLRHECRHLCVVQSWMMAHAAYLGASRQELA